LLSTTAHRYHQSLTFIDLLYLPYANTLTNAGYDYFTNEERYPNIARWWKEISARESWLAVRDGIPPSL